MKLKHIKDKELDLKTKCTLQKIKWHYWNKYEFQRQNLQWEIHTIPLFLLDPMIGSHKFYNKKAKIFQIVHINHKLKFIPIFCTMVTYVDLKWENFENLCALFSIDDMHSHWKFCLFKIYKCVSRAKKYYVKSTNIAQGKPSTTTHIKWKHQGHQGLIGSHQKTTK